MQDCGVARLWEIARFETISVEISYFLATVFLQMNVKVASDVDPKY